MSELPDDVQRAFAELPREWEPDPALEERVVRAVFPSRRRWAWVSIAVAAAAVLLVVARPWSKPQPVGQTYVLLLSPGPNYMSPPPGHMGERRAEYGRWADSLARLGKLEVGGRLDEQPVGEGDVNGLFIIRAADDSDAARIAASCPHTKYRGHIVVRRFIE